MVFQTVKTALETTLKNEAANRFDVVGYQVQSKSSEVFTKRLTVFYRGGNFPLSSSGRYGSPIEHNMEFELEFTVFTVAEMDLSVMENPSSTADMKAAAIAFMQDAGKIADDLIDQFFSDVWNIIMSAENPFFGMDPYAVQDRWIEDIQKDSPVPTGEYFILTGRSRLTCSVCETPNSETGTTATTYDTTVNIQDDPNDNAGASGTLGG